MNEELIDRARQIERCERFLSAILVTGEPVEARQIVIEALDRRGTPSSCRVTVGALADGPGGAGRDILILIDLEPSS